MNATISHNKIPIGHAAVHSGNILIKPMVYAVNSLKRNHTPA